MRGKLTDYNLFVRRRWAWIPSKRAHKARLLGSMDCAVIGHSFVWIDKDGWSLDHRITVHHGE